MAQTMVKNFIHIVFSTKNREPFINPEIQERLHSYLGGICMSLECHVILVIGSTDHVHILCNLSKKIELMTLIQKLKANSSKWIKTIDVNCNDFKWQEGYAAFSVHYNEIAFAKMDIQNQHEHHREMPFKEEYLALLRKHDVDFDERYVWD